MVWLEVALAFVLAMLLLSTIASAVVQMIQRLRRERQADLEVMLQRLVRGYVLPAAGADQPSTDPSARVAEIDKVVAAVIDNPLVTPRDRQEHAAGVAYAGFMSRFSGPQVTSITVLELMERLGSTPTGLALYEKRGEDGTRVIIADLAQKFDALGRQTLNTFTVKARALTLIVSIGVAFALNVEATRLVHELMTNSDARARVLALEQSLPVFADIQARTGDQSAAESLKDIEQSVKQLTDLGLPFGLSHFPYACLDPKADADMRAICKDATLGDYLHWGLWTLVAGLLIGMGAPFWFDAARGISKTLRGIRGGGPEPSTTAAAAAASGDGGAAVATAVPANGAPTTPIDAFLTAVKAAKLRMG